MSTLYIDTTTFLNLALFDEERNLVDKILINEKKQSTLLHHSIFSLLEKNNLKIQDIKNIVTIAGPGSYTGMRVSEGMSQIFSWHNFNTFSFYHFDIPAYLGEKEYLWTANAFKGEQFVFHYKDGEAKTFRMNNENFQHFLSDYDDVQVYSNEGEYTNTGELFFKDSKKILEKVIADKLRKEVYYYRSIEEEFKPSVKI